MKEDIRQFLDREEAAEQTRLDAQLRREIQQGIDSGTATPLDIEEIKAQGRKRLAGQQTEG